MKILQLNDMGTKLALKHEALAGLPLIGRGKFSTVYDNGDTVLHLTVDPVSYSLHCDGVTAVKGPHFSRVVNDYGDIGEQKRGGLVIYLFETEKLAPLRGNINARRTAKAIIKTMWGVDRLESIVGLNGRTHGVYLRDIVMRAVSVGKFPPSICDALRQMSDFVLNSGSFALFDLHNANFMVRPSDGVLVFNDPMCDGNIYYEATNRLRANAR